MIVTSFSQRGYWEYGERFIESFIANWPDETLTCYYEKRLPRNHPVDDRVSYVNLYDFEDFKRFENYLKESDPLFSGMMSGKKRGQEVYNYRFDAARFWKKVYAITGHCLDNPNQLVAWVDADVYVHTEVPEKLLESLIEEGDMAATLQRPHTYTECGFILFDTSHPLTATFMKNYWALYASGAFRYAGEWHDSFLFDMVTTWMEVPISDITEGKESDHPLIHSRLGAHFDHLKGSRKEAGRSAKHENKAGHTGPYWDEDESDVEVREKVRESTAAV